AETFRGEPFVRLPKKRLPEVAAVSGSNYVEVGFAVADALDPGSGPGSGPSTGKRLVTCFAVSDNLIKGGAGQAIQSMNVMLVVGGSRVVITHGGGPQATSLSKKLGLEPRLVGGRRVTDAATLDVMKMVIAGQVNVDLCAQLRAAGLRPVGLHDIVRAHKRPP